MKKHGDLVGLPNKTFLHAEVHAIVKCKNLEKAHKMHVFRFDANGKPRNAKPCPVCQSAINEAGIEHVEWTY
jgi:deoxycytidylate deaminase